MGEGNVKILKNKQTHILPLIGEVIARMMT